MRTLFYRRAMSKTRATFPLQRLTGTGMDYLVDTNVISETIKSTPNKGVVDFLHATDFWLSCIVFAELAYGAHRLPDLHQSKQKYLTFINSLKHQYSKHIIPVSLDIAETSGTLRAEQEGKGRALSNADALIAATAIHTRVTLVTRNTRDFAQLGIALLNPFSP